MPSAPRKQLAARADRSKPIMIRLTPEEWQRLEAAARRAGLGLGPWLRLLGLREADTGSASSPPGCSGRRG